MACRIYSIRPLLAALSLGCCAVALAQDDNAFDPESLEFERVLAQEKSEEDRKDKKNKAGKIEVEALLMLDAQQLDGILVEEDSVVRARVRRARFGISRDLSDRLQADLSFDIDDEDEQIGVRNASLEYKHEGGGHLEFGLFKPDFGLEQSVSSRELRTLERSMASEAFSPEAGIGVAWNRTHPRFNLSVGAFLNPDEDNTHDLTARISLAPLVLGSKRRLTLLHLGASIARHSGDEQEFRIRQSGGIDSAENFLRSAEYAISGRTTVGGELALVWRALTLQGEWFQQSLSLEDRTAADDDPQFEGSYVQLAWLFGGARRAYEGGVFDRVRAGDGLPLELVANVSQLDARFDGIGGEAEQWSLGLNYWISKQAKIMGHYFNVSNTDGDSADDDGRGVVVRLQLDL